MVLGESAVVAVLAAVVGGLLGTAAAPAFLEIMRWKGLLSVDLEHAGALAGLVDRRPGGDRGRAARRLALLQAGLPGLAGRGVPGGGPRAAPAERVAAGDRHDLPRRRGRPPGAGPRAQPGLRPGHGNPDARGLVIGLYCFGGWVFPALAGLLARPFAGRDVSARLARDHVRTAVRTPVALAAPIVAISAVAGSMILALSFMADWVTTLDREQLATPYVVDTGGDASVGDRLAGVPLADPRVTVIVPVGAERDDQDVDVVDPANGPRGAGDAGGEGRSLEAGPRSRDHRGVVGRLRGAPGGQAPRCPGGGGGARRPGPLLRRDRAAVAGAGEVPGHRAGALLRRPRLGRPPRPARGHRRDGAHRRRVDRRDGRADPGQQQPGAVDPDRPGGPLRRDRDRELGPGRRLPAPRPAADRRAAGCDPRPAAPDGAVGGRPGRRGRARGRRRDHRGRRLDGPDGHLGRRRAPAVHRAVAPARRRSRPPVRRSTSSPRWWVPAESGMSDWWRDPR